MKRIIFGLRVVVVCAFSLGATSCGDDTNKAVCGNGILEPGEKCDINIAQGQNGACPDVTACDDHNPCTRDRVAGSMCQATCAHENIMEVIPNDGCCVSGMPAMEPECAGCGDGVLQSGELCDPAITSGPGRCPTSNDCLPAQCKKLMGMMCQAHCEDITMASGTMLDGCCPSGANAMTDADCTAVCGNGLVESGEQCDTGISSGTGKCPTNAATDCNDNQACTADTIQGTQCQAHCVHAQITTPSGSVSDGCCPTGANHNTDIDCSVSCGNGVVEAGETCDTAITTGAGKCPTMADCNDTNACTTDTLLSGGTCNATCSHMPVTAVGPADGCCPPAGNANTDPDCTPVCGNGALESPEQCDTAIPVGNLGHCPANANDCNDSNVCTTDAVTGAGCQAHCTHTVLPPSGATRDGCCPPGANSNTDADCLAACGNGVVEPAAGELCDIGITSGAGKCPTNAATDCDDSDACTVDTIAGTGCTAHCVHTPKQGPADCSTTNNDMCCPVGCTFATDLNCPMGCNDGVLETGESCENVPPASTFNTCGPAMNTTCRCPVNASTDCNDANSCTSDAISGSAATCTAVCTHTPITQIGPADNCCPPGGNISNDPDCPARCGDGVVTPSAGETCDNGIPSGMTGACDNCPVLACSSLTQTGMASTCDIRCEYTPAACSGATHDSCCSPGCNGSTDIDCAVCGNGTRELGELCDGAFNATNAHTALTPSGNTCPGSDANCAAFITANPSLFPDGAVCYTGTFGGSVNSCTATCTFAEAAPSPVSDGCCPRGNGGNGSNDPDCASCGNGVVDTINETCDTAIAGNLPGHCPTFAECRAATSNACSPSIKTGSACNQTCTSGSATTCGASEQTCIQGAPRSVDPACGTAGHPPCCLLPPGDTACAPSSVDPSCGTTGHPPCCGNLVDPVCCTSMDGCCPATCLDSFLFDPTCAQTNCGGSGQPRCCTPSAAQNGDADCYCGDGRNPAVPGQHGEACEQSDRNNFNGCTDSCTPGVACILANGCTPNTDAGAGTPTVGIPCLGGNGLGLIDNSYCKTGTTGLLCATERIDQRFQGGYCSKGAQTGNCQTATGGTDPCPAGSTCVNSATGGYICLQGCPAPGSPADAASPLEYACRYNEGYHCVPIPAGVGAPFCASGAANYNAALNSCYSCASLCGDGTMQAQTGEQCDSGAAFLDPTNLVPENYAAGGCTTSCTARLNWLSDPCRQSMLMIDCAVAAAQAMAAGKTPLCVSYDPSMGPGPTNDPKFRTRYDVYSAGNGGFQNNGYCSMTCNLLAQDCPTLTIGATTLRGVCVPGGGQAPPTGVCVEGCISNTQCRVKEGYRCVPIDQLLGFSAVFDSEGPRACINPGSAGTNFQGP